MIWTVFLIKSLLPDIVKVHASLPSVKEVLGRTRWCLGEGEHCPVNLPVSSCCKPFVCTVIPKTRKPTWFLKATEYKDHRCLLPSIKPPDIEVITTPHNDTIIDSTFAENISRELKENTTFNMVTLNHIGRNNGDSYVQTNTSECLNTSSVEVLDESSGDINEYIYDLDSANETHSHECKNYPSIKTQPDRNENEGKGKIVKRSLTNYSSEFNEDSSSSKYAFNSSELNNASESSEVGSQSALQSIETYSDYSSISISNQSSMAQNNFFSHLNSSDPHDNTDSHHGLDLSHGYTSEFSNITFKEDSFNRSLPDTDATSHIQDGSEEDWHSSDMQYDTRPTLRKVVTIQPFNFFDTVEVTRLNVSIENSLA